MRIKNSKNRLKLAEYLANDIMLAKYRINYSSINLFHFIQSAYK